MRLPYLMLSLLLVFDIFIDVYIYRYLATTFRARIWSRIQAWSAVAFTLLFLVVLVIPVRSASNSTLVCVMWMIYTYASVYIPKIIFVIFDAIGRIPTLFKHKKLKYVTGSGTIFAAVCFLCMWWGVAVTRNHLDTKEVEYVNASLPPAFNGFKIAQISDMHLSAYNGDTTFVHKIVKHINALNPDIIVFTGDMVSRTGTEATPFVNTLSKLKAKYGVYSVLGNHDYGDYEDWSSEQAKFNDHNKLIESQKQMGWTLLRDSTAVITLNNDTLMLIGVENIGHPPFKVYGSLEKAYPTAADNHFKILLSHDPSHWQYSIHNNKTTNIALTLSGHTHAMQMEFWNTSPAALVHKYWSGMYTDDYGKSLYVNIGTGTVGFPSRIGTAYPEITLITLKK